MTNDKKFYLILLIVLICVGLLFLFLAHNTRNTAVGMEEQIAAAESQINVQEKRRADLIPSLVECVKENFKLNTLYKKTRFLVAVGCHI